MSFAWRQRGAGSLPVAIGLIALTLASAHAQQDGGTPPQQSDQQAAPKQSDQQEEARDIGWIYGLVTGPTGVPQNGGTISLSTDGGITLRYNITVSSKGDYTGRVPLGEYTLVYRAPDTPEGKVTDYIHSVAIDAGKGTKQDVDMTREEYLDRLTPEQQEQLRQIKESHDKASVAKKNIAAVNADFHTVNRDFEDAANARAMAIQTLGPTASASDVEAKVAEIRVTKYTEIESLMSKAAAEMPTEATIWISLGRAQVGLENYLDAEISFKKAVDLTVQTANTDPQLTAAANAGLGEVYARTLMVDEANASFAAAAKADPAHAPMYLRNLAIIFFQEKKAWAQIDAANEAIKANPEDALLYFIKAQGLAIDARIDPDTNKINLSPECAAAFQKYLELAPTGEYAAQATSILQNAGFENMVPQNVPLQNANRQSTALQNPARQSAPPQNTNNNTGAANPPAQK